MITGIDLSKLRNSEYIQFIKDSLKITLGNNPFALNIKPQYDNLGLGLAALEALFVTEQGSAITEQVTAEDARRDNAINGITTLVNAYSYHFDPVMVKHAKNLSWQIGQYGNGIARENYQSETTIITGIITDFNTKPDLIAAVTALQLTAWKTELEAANEAFNAAYLQRTQELGAASPETILATRLETNAKYYEMRDFINSYFTINKGAAPYNKVSGELNALIEQYNTMLAKKNTEPKEEIPPSNV
jgi:hypothetical protein